MPDYVVTDPKTGEKKTFTGDSPPTKEMLDKAFRFQPKRSPDDMLEPFFAMRSEAQTRHPSTGESLKDIERFSQNLLLDAGNVPFVPLDIVAEKIGNVKEEAGKRESIIGKIAAGTGQAGLEIAKFPLEMGRFFTDSATDLIRSSQVLPTYGIAKALDELGLEGMAAKEAKRVKESKDRVFENPLFTVLGLMGLGRSVKMATPKNLKGQLDFEVVEIKATPKDNVKVVSTETGNPTKLQKIKRSVSGEPSSEANKVARDIVQERSGSIAYGEFKAQQTRDKIDLKSQKIVKEQSMRKRIVAQLKGKGLGKQIKEDMIFYRQKTGNPFIKGDTFEALKKRMPESAKKFVDGPIAKHMDQLWEFLNESDYLNSKSQTGISYLNDYLTQMYIGSKDQIAQTATNLQRNFPFAKKRKWKSYHQAITEGGLQMRYTDIGQIIQYYENLAHRVIANNKMVENFKGLRTTDGKGIVYSSKNIPSNLIGEYTRIDNPIFKRLYTIKGEEVSRSKTRGIRQHVKESENVSKKTIEEMSGKLADQGPKVKLENVVREKSTEQITKKANVSETAQVKNQWVRTREIIDNIRKTDKSFESEFKNKDFHRGYARLIEKHWDSLPKDIQEWWLRRPSFKDFETGEFLNVPEHGVRGTTVFDAIESFEQFGSSGPKAKLEKVVRESLQERGFSEGEANNFILRLKGSSAKDMLEVIKTEEITKERLKTITKSEVETIIKERKADRPIQQEGWVHPEIAGPLMRTLDRGWDMNHDLYRWIKTANAITKKAMLSMSFFHHLALTESAIATGNYSVINGWYKGKKLLQGRNKIVEDAIRSGLKVDATNDIHLGTVNKFLARFEQKARNIPLLNYGANTLNWANKKWDHLLWDSFHRDLKMGAYYDVFTRNLKRYPDRNPKELAKEAANFINDAFGGQNWDGYMTKNFKKGEQVAQLLFLAPDWGISNLKIAARGVGAIAGLGPKSVRKDALAYWARAGAMFTIGQQMAQYGFWAANSDTTKSPWMWDNPPEHKFSLRTYSHDEQGREIYVKPLKQAREVLRYFSNFTEIVGNKFSPVTREVIEEFTGSSPGSGFDLPYKHMELYESIPERLKSALGKLVPLSAKDKGSFAYALPKSTGMNNYKTTELFSKTLTDYAESDSGAALNFLDEIKFHSDDNNLETKELFNRSMSIVKGRYYKELFVALNNEDVEKADKIAEYLKRLDADPRYVERSLQRRYEKMLRENGIKTQNFEHNTEILLEKITGDKNIENFMEILQ